MLRSENQKSLGEGREPPLNDCEKALEPPLKLHPPYSINNLHFPKHTSRCHTSVTSPSPPSLHDLLLVCALPCTLGTLWHVTLSGLPHPPNEHPECLAESFLTRGEQRAGLGSCSVKVSARRGTGRHLPEPRATGGR